MQESSVSIPLPQIEDFEQKVIDAAARQLLMSRSYNEDGDEVRYRSELGRKIEDAMVETIREQAREAAPDVARELLERGTRRTNTWGDPEGSTIPLSTIVADEVKKNLTHNNGRRGEGVLDMLIREEIQRTMRGQLNAVVEEARKPILDAMREEATAVFEKAMRKALPGASL